MIRMKEEKKKIMKYKLINGLFGVSEIGILTTPNRKYNIKLPKKIAFWLQSFLNSNISYVGMKGTKLLFRSDY